MTTKPVHLSTTLFENSRIVHWHPPQHCPACYPVGGEHAVKEAQDRTREERRFEGKRRDKTMDGGRENETGSIMLEKEDEFM